KHLFYYYLRCRNLVSWVKFPFTAKGIFTQFRTTRALFGSDFLTSFGLAWSGMTWGSRYPAMIARMSSLSEIFFNDIIASPPVVMNISYDILASCRAG
ncbi:MAG: hypothetical protein PVF33_10765, partial [Candidatus Latescibacterota bacterium]